MTRAPSIVCLAVAGVLAAGSVWAQDAPQKAPTPITVEAPPQIDIEDESIEISGETAIDAKDPRVTLVAVAPTGRRYEWSVAVIEPGGGFSTELRFQFFTPEPGPGEARIEPGKWRVEARSPGKLGTASTTFMVTRRLEAKDEPWARESPNVATAASALVANLATCLRNMPISPVRNEVTAAVEQLRAHLQSGPDRVARDLTAAMNLARQLPDQFEHLEDLLEPLEDDLKAWAREIRDVNRPSPRDPARCAWAQSPCEPADVLAADLKALQGLLDLLKRPVDLMTRFNGEPLNAEAKKKAVMPDLTPLRLSLQNAAKALNGPDGLGTWLNQATTLRQQVTSHVAGRVFDPYCERFTGDFSLDFEAHFRNSAGTPWWTYSMTMAGKLNLRYPKASADNRVDLTGEFSGCATKFKSWDDALRVGWPKLMAGAMTYRTVKEPFDGRSGGCAAAFTIPVRGELKGNQVTIEVQGAAEKDFGTQSARVTYMIVSPLAGGLPARTSFELPYKDAHFIISRALQNKPMMLPVKVVGKQMVIESRTETTSGTDRSKGIYKLNAKACNPSCGK